MFFRISKLKWIEIAAVISGMLYTFLITYGSLWCWPAALISSVLFAYLCVQKKIYAESALHVFYFFSGIYGWYNWGQSEIFSPSSLGLDKNLEIIGLGILLIVIIGSLLRKYTDTKLPYLDVFTTVFSIFATFMMIYMIRENWIYWLVIDTVSIVLYWRRGLYVSVVLFIMYDILSINGLLQWQ